MTASGQGYSSTLLYASLNGSSELPPNDSPYVGTGRFSLDGDSGSLSYQVNIPSDFSPTSAGIYGAANESQSGRLIFDLGNYGSITNSLCIITWDNPPDCFTNITTGYAGHLTLTPDQQQDFKNHLWYVNLTSVEHPEGEIRGQIASTSVPEPNALVLLFLGAVSFAAVRKRGKLNPQNRMP